jgi:hypothetical protein
VNVDITTNNNNNSRTRERDFKTFNVDSQREGEYEDKTPRWKYYLTIFLVCYVLFNGVITLMGLAFSYYKTVTDRTARTQGVLYVAVYAPVGYLFMYYLVFNNYYSEKVYNIYLKRNAIISYPSSGKWEYWVKTPRPLVFVIYTLTYLAFMMWFFGSTGADFNTYYVFISNILVQIFLFWVSQQTVESRFVSVSNYIASFKNKDGEREGMDEVNLKKSTSSLASAVLVRTTKAAYTSNMAVWYWQHEKDYSKTIRYLIRLLWLGIIIGVIAIAISLFQADILKSTEKMWRDTVNPCLAVCRDDDPCACIRDCKVAAKQQDNGSCKDAAPPQFRPLACC